MRYVCRPPIASERLFLLESGLVVYGLRRPFDDGTTAIVLTQNQLIRRIKSLIPPPRTKMVHYFGVLAPASKMRSAVIPGSGRKWWKRSKGKRIRQPRPWLTFEQLLLIGFGVELKCSRCGAKMLIRQLVLPAQAGWWLRLIRPRVAAPQTLGPPALAGPAAH